MTAHVSGSQFERYLGRALPPAEILALHRHLETCLDCREALAEASLARQSSAAIPLLMESRDPHLLEDEMVSFVAQRMTESQAAAAAAHIAECEQCRDSVEAMESVRSQPAVIPLRRRRAPGWIAVLGAAAAALLISALIYFRPSVPIVASLRDSGQAIDLSADGTLRGLAGLSPEEQNLIREAMKQGTLPAGPRFAAETPGTLRATEGTKPEFALIAPVGVRVLADRPDFTWEPGRDVTAYEVVVTNEALDPLARSGRIEATHWQPETSLPRGVMLLWQVRAWHGETMVSVPAPPAPPARFEIVGQDVANRVEQLRASPSPSHLLIAILCAREGLREEEAKELQTLAAENPGSPLISRLRTSLN